MKILELMANYGFFTNPLVEKGATVFKVDQALYPNLDLVINLNYFDKDQVKFEPELIWARIPGTHFSVASMGKHWNSDNSPKSDEAVNAIRLVENVVKIIHDYNPKFWGIECTRGKLRKLNLIDNKYLKTISLCTYGDQRMKPTDIWCNFFDLWTPKTMCKNGDPCHIPAPRGSRTGSQADSNEKNKFTIPKELPIEIYRVLKDKV